MMATHRGNHYGINAQLTSQEHTSVFQYRPSFPDVHHCGGDAGNAFFTPGSTIADPPTEMLRWLSSMVRRLQDRLAFPISFPN